MHEDSQPSAEVTADPYIELAAEVFTLLADPTRIRLILALGAGERSVGELAEQVRKSPTAVSQHLAKLRLAKAVQARQEGNRVYYSLIDEHALELVTQAVFQAEHVADGFPRHHLSPPQFQVNGRIGEVRR